MRTVRVDVYSDYTCPWCYLGSERLKRAVAELPAGALEVEWKPLEIHPEVPAEGMPVEDLGYPPEQWEAMQRSLRLQAEAEGVELGGRTTVANTHDALAASAYARTEEPDRFDALHDALFRAYFVEGRDIGDRAVLRDVAAAAGLDADALAAALDARRYDGALAETANFARAHGITGTPTFVFDDRYAVVGAQPTDTLVRVVQRLAERDKDVAEG